MRGKGARTWGRCVALSALCGGAACSGTPAPAPRPSRPAAIPAEPGGLAYPSPARWSYHPPAPEQAVAWSRLGDGGCLVLAEGGHRWMVAAPRAPAGAAAPALPAPGALPAAANAGGSAAPPCSGKGTVSQAPAPEDLVGFARRSAGAWVFFGESGALYEAASPLGPFLRATPPPAPLARIAGAAGALLAVTREGGLLRWDEAESGWKPAPVAPPAAPGAASAAPLANGGRAPWIFDVAVGEGGRALALAVPESLFASSDGGATWARAPVAAAGLHRLGVLPGGELAAEGVFTSVAWDPRRASAPFAPAPAALPPREPQVAIEAAPSPSPAAARAGRAAIAGDRYYEVQRPEDTSLPWTLLAGSIEGPLEARPIPGTAVCQSLRLGAGGRTLVAVCVRGEDDVILAEVLRSDDAGARWSKAPVARLTTPDTDGIGVAVSPEGAALLTGVCKPADARSGGSSSGECRPGAPVLIRMEGDRAAVTVAAASTLGDRASLPAFSVDGRSAYFLGDRTKDRRLALFVSHDAGESFVARPLGRARGTRSDEERPVEPEPEDDDEEAEREAPAADERPLEITEDSVLRPAEDGAVGMLLLELDAPVLVTTDDDGRVLSFAAPPAPPAEGALIGVAGRRAIAIAPVATSSSEPEGRAGQAGVGFWESLDGGESWSEQPPSPVIAAELFRGTAGIACGLGGCLLGDSLTRVGWAGQADPGPALAPAREPARREPAVRTPIVCELAPRAPWTRVERPEAGSVGLPGANEAMRGRSLWSVLTRDDRDGVAAVSAMLPESGAGEARVVTRPLFPPAAKGTRLATHVSLQMEGYAAARVRVPGAPRTPIPPGSPLRNVEVAWENWIEGTSGRAAVPDAGAIELGDVKPAADDAYDPDLLSVSLRGIFLRPHAAGTPGNALTFFLEPGRRAKPLSFSYPTWPGAVDGRPLDVRSDAVFADGRPVPVGMVHLGGGNGPVTTVLLAHGGAASGRWDFNAATVAPPPSPAGPLAHTDWTYAGATIGVTALISDPARARGWAVFQPFRGDGTLGPAQPLPTPFDLPDPPRPCSAAQRAATARLEAVMFVRNDALFPGTRHPVLVLDAAAPVASSGPAGPAGVVVHPLTMLTTSAVMHGDPASPCVAAWDAYALGNVGSVPFSAILSGDLAHAWLFRVVPRGRAEPLAIEARPMSCRFDPTAKVPDAVWSQPATSRAAP